jgi:hypothetical protein
MQRLVIAAASAALLLGAAAPVMADDYPPCTTPGQDHCRVVPMSHAHGHHHKGHHHHKGADKGAAKTDDKSAQH